MLRKANVQAAMAAKAAAISAGEDGGREYILPTTQHDSTKCLRRLSARRNIQGTRLPQQHYQEEILSLEDRIDR